MFTNTFAPLVGGIEKSVATFAEDLRALGNEVLTVTLQQDDDDRTEPGTLRLPALPRFAGGPYACPLPGAVGLDRALDEFRPEVLHAHQPFLLGDSAYRHAVRRGLPLVFTNHTLYERYADRTFLGEFAGLERAARKLAVVYANRCEAVIAPTQSIADILRGQGVTPDIAVVPTGIDVDRFARGDGAAFRQRHGIPADAFVAGHLGRLIPAKNVGFLAGAVAEFLRREPRGRALFCGEGQSVDEIREAFRAAGVEERLIMLGVLAPAEIADAYAAMDVFAFASLTDTQGIVLLEAMAAGTPVMALRATGPQDLVVDGVSGRLLDPGLTGDEFAQGLVEESRIDDRTPLREAARRRAGAFDRRACAEQLVEVYESARRRLLATERPSEPAESVLDEFQRRVEAEWELFAGRAAILRALLPSRGFPEIGGS